MTLLASILIIIISLGVILIIHSRKKQQNLSDKLPGQTKLISELHSEMGRPVMELQFYEGQEQVRSEVFSFMDIAGLSESDHPLSEEKYDDCPIYFRVNTGQLLSFKKYLLNEILPITIKEELRPFYNKTYSPIEDPEKSYFIIQFQTELHKSKHETEKYFRGTGEAFENWMTFTESAGNLIYILKQSPGKNIPESRLTTYQI